MSNLTVPGHTIAGEEWLYLKDDLPEMFAGLHHPMARRGLGQGEGLVDWRAQLASLERRSEPSDKGTDDLRLFDRRTGAQGGSEDFKMAAQDQAQIDFRLGSSHQSDQHQASTVSEGV